jgi:hypothetical protein
MILWAADRAQVPYFVPEYQRADQCPLLQQIGHLCILGQIGSE